MKEYLYLYHSTFFNIFQIVTLSILGVYVFSVLDSSERL